MGENNVNKEELWKQRASEKLKALMDTQESQGDWETDKETEQQSETTPR